MKNILLFISISVAASLWSQESEMLVPKDAITVISIDNISLLQKISLDDLVSYQFMEEIQSELFDGSTHNKTIKDSGIDFEQRFNVFKGRVIDYEIAGFSFGIKDKSKLFEVFDDFDPIESSITGVEVYASFFNRLIIKDNAGLLLRVNPDFALVDEVTDSIWIAQGHEYEWFYDDYDYDSPYEAPMEEEYQEFYEEILELQEIEESLEEVEEIYDIESIEVEDEYYDEGKTYQELHDSVEWVLQNEYMAHVLKELFEQNISLYSEDSRFAEQLTHKVDGIFYLDNSRQFVQNGDIWYFQAMYPQLFLDIQELYKDNHILGDFQINEHSIEMNSTTHFSEDLGEIYQAMNDAKFNKKVRDYIHDENSAFFTYNVNLRKAYEKTLDIIIPILEKEPSSKVSANLMVIELLDEFLNKDAIFDAYQGSMFGTFNGIKTIKTEKWVFEYDPETYEYEEHLTEAEEQMPVFTMGYATKRLDIAEKIMGRLSRLSTRIHEEEDYWVIDKAFLNTAPVYVITKNDLFIITNDEDLAKNHSSGYGADRISKKKLKIAKKSGSIYASADLGKAVEQLPRDIFNDQENELLDVVRGKSGHVELTSSGTNNTSFDLKLVYQFEGEYENSGTYILDLINSIYVLMH